MLRLLTDWYHRHFSDPQVAMLALLLGILFSVILLIGDIIAPLLASVIIAYLLEGVVSFLHQRKIPRFIAVMIVFSAFILLLLSTLFILTPLLIGQATEFVLEIPKMLVEGQKWLMRLPETYPTIISEQHVIELIAGLRSQVTEVSQQVLSFSLASMVDLLSFMVYLVIVPLLVFFFLKDKRMVMKWFQSFLPGERPLLSSVWEEMNSKIAGYVRGKFAEILIIWVVSYISFLFLGLNYAMLLSFAVGVSVLIPYVGAAVVTLPITIVAYLQWGYNSDFIYVMVAYAIIQFLDGNLLVPLLFSEMVNLHPAAIIVAVLVFGGLWGFWGVFFAIPLATLIHAVLNAWPNSAAHLQKNLAVATDTPKA